LSLCQFVQLHQCNVFVEIDGLPQASSIRSRLNIFFHASEYGYTASRCFNCHVTFAFPLHL